MKLVAVIVLGGTMIVGCAGAPRVTGATGAKAPASTTTLTSATVSRSAVDPNPRYLSIEAETPDAPRTWGASPSEQEATEADLARNPYTYQDIYDPR